MTGFVLQSGEHLLRKDIVSFLQGTMKVQPGNCYITSRRIVTEKYSPVVRAFLTLSALGGWLKRKLVKPEWSEIPLSSLVEISQLRYGMNPHVLALSTGGEPVVRIVFSRRQMQGWMQALAAEGKMLQQSGENSWRVVPRQP